MMRYFLALHTTYRANDPDTVIDSIPAHTQNFAYTLPRTDQHLQDGVVYRVVQPHRAELFEGEGLLDL
jgi:hypothetical protein